MFQCTDRSGLSYFHLHRVYVLCIKLNTASNGLCGINWILWGILTFCKSLAIYHFMVKLSCDLGCGTLHRIIIKGGVGWCYQSLMKTDRRANASGSTTGVALSSFMADGEWVGPPPRCFPYLQASVLCCWQMRCPFSNIRSREPGDVNNCAGVSSCSATWNERVNLSLRWSSFLGAVSLCLGAWTHWPWTKEILC